MFMFGINLTNVTYFLFIKYLFVFFLMGVKEYFIMFLDTVFCSRLEFIINSNEIVNEGIISVHN